MEWYAIQDGVAIRNTHRPRVVGNAFSGASQFAEFLSRLPASQHEITAYDCQPIAGIVSHVSQQNTTGLIVLCP